MKTRSLLATTVLAVACNNAGLALAQAGDGVVFGSEYACNAGMTRFIVKSCNASGLCDVQYLNAAAPQGLGGLAQMWRETLVGSLQGCTVAGHAAGAAPRQADAPVQAQAAAPAPTLAPAPAAAPLRAEPLARAPAANAAPAISLPDGRYTCLIVVGRNTRTFGFVDIRGGTYRGPSNSLDGPFAPFTVSEDGLINWSRGFGETDTNGVHYQSAKVIPGGNPRFQVYYTLPSGRLDGMDCGRE